MQMQEDQLDAGFFKSLFDLSFDRWVTPRLLKAIYVLVMIVVGLAYLAYVFLAFRASSALGLATLIVIGPLIAVFYLVLWRVLLAVVMAIFKIAEYTRAVASSLPTTVVSAPPAAAPPAGPATTGFPPPP
jgi:phage-related protein